MFLKEKIEALEDMESQLDRRYKAIKSYKKRSGDGMQNNFKGELFIWDESGNNKILIEFPSLLLCCFKI